MNIAFFISDHGFGHIMRELPVIKYLVSLNHNVVVVCSKRCNDLAKDYLIDENQFDHITFIDFHTDTGITVIPGTIKIDETTTAINVEAMQADYPKLESFACNIMNQYMIERVVVDIVPWAIKAAKICGITSCLMLSFTWLDQYGYCIDDKSKAIFINCFNMADHYLYYDLCNQDTRNLLKNGINVGFVSREFHPDKVQDIRNRHNRKIVFLSLGGSNSGLDFNVDVSGLNYDFITTDALKVVGSNVEYIPLKTNNTQDYIKAADYCISKAGWTTVAEIMLANTKTALLKRPEVKEDSQTIIEMVSRGAAIEIEVDELRNMKNVLKKLEEATWIQQDYKNNFEGIANIIIDA